MQLDLNYFKFSRVKKLKQKSFKLKIILKLYLVLFYELDFILIPLANFVYRLKLLFGAETDPRLWILSEIDYILNRRKEENVNNN